MKTRPIRLMTATGVPRTSPTQSPAPGVPARVVRGAEQARLARDVGDDLALVEDVIAGGHHVDAGGEQTARRAAA